MAMAGTSRSWCWSTTAETRFQLQPLQTPMTIIIRILTPPNNTFVSLVTPFNKRNFHMGQQQQQRQQQRQRRRRLDSIRVSYRGRMISAVDFDDGGGGEESESKSNGGDGLRFERAVSLFNGREFYKCHDLLEQLWYGAEEPKRTLFHAILQCAVAFHHLFNHNHRGAMMELGEGLCKLQKMNFTEGPFLQFEKEISAALDFIYQTQLEQAACIDDLCLAMDGSERSYQLLGSFAAGQHLYKLESNEDEVLYIVFSPDIPINSGKPARVKVPTLHATREHLKAFDDN